MVKALALAAAATCPGSSAHFHHASCQLEVSFEQDCATVEAEMVARIDGENGWYDPHNKGTYKVEDKSAGVLDVSRLTGNKKYTDKLRFTFSDAEAGGCSLAACSESQVFSILDMGTNYCNLHDLYAGSQDGIKVAKTDLKYTEKVSSCTDASNKGSSKCNVADEAEAVQLVELAAASTCPGSSAHLHHASCQLEASFEQDCATVEAEMVARIDGENGWYDPHNKGTYKVEDKSAGVLDVSRLTGNKKYTDKLRFTFSDAEAGGCSLAACSESQVTSLLDFGTNYCNLHDLYAGSQDGIKVAKTDLKYTEKVGSCTDASNKGGSKCNVADEESATNTFI